MLTLSNSHGVMRPFAAGFLDLAVLPTAVGSHLRARAADLHGTPPRPAGGGPVVEGPAAPLARAALEPDPRTSGGCLGAHPGDAADHPAERIMIRADQTRASPPVHRPGVS